MFIASGCIALMMSGHVACYSGTTLYCSDQNFNLPIPTCAEWNKEWQMAIDAAKQSGCMSQDGSTSSCVLTAPQLPVSR